MKDNLKPKMEGRYRDIFKYEDGRVVVSEWNKNLIVNDNLLVIAYALKGDGGLKYWAIGEGGVGWDNTNPPSPIASNSQLESEIFRKEIQEHNINYVDSDDEITTDVTSNIMISLEFGASDANGEWREFSIVGGDADASANSGIIINHKTHPLLIKTTQVIIERQIIFSIGL